MTDLKAQVTIISSEKPTFLGKTYDLTSNGLTKTTAGQMIAGTYEIREIDGVAELTQLLQQIGTHQALTASVPNDCSTSGRITTRLGRASNPSALTRTKECFGFPKGRPGLVILDYDPHGETLHQHELWRLLTELVPKVADAGVVWWCSGSSHIYSGDVSLQGLRGQRFYVLVKDVADTVRFGTVLAKRLWLAGHGRIEVSSSGALLNRSVFDCAMNQPARLDFIGGAVCRPPLQQRRGEPVPMASGGYLDSKAALPDLSAVDEALYEAFVAQAKERMTEQSSAMRLRWKQDRLSSGIADLLKAGVPTEQARERAERTLDSALSGVLLGDFDLLLEGGVRLTVGDVLDNREKYHGAVCLDPLNPSHRGGAYDARLFLYGPTPHLYSYDDGGKRYTLRRQPARLYLRRGGKGELAIELLKWVAQEPDLFSRGGVLVQVEDDRVKPVRKARLANLVSTRVALYVKDAKGHDLPCDVPADVIDQLAELVTGG